MILRTRRVAVFATALALAGGATAALGAAPSGAASPRAAATSSTVGVNGLCGSIIVAPIAANLRQGGSESSKLRLFRERLDYPLVGGVPTDFSAIGLYSTPSSLVGKTTTIASGTHVNSYIVHSDPIGNDPLLREHRAATISFTADVLGVEVLSTTLAESQSLQLRAPGVKYTNAASGLELAASGGGDFARLVDRHTVAISFKTSSAVDEIRIVTRATTSTASALGGYRMLAADGGVFDFGGQQFYGSTGGRVLNKPVTAGINTCSNAGYWFVASDGGVFSYGDAKFYGSLGGRVLTSPVVAMAATPTGAGYYLVTANGGIYPYGDAHTFNNGAGHHDLTYIKQLNKPIVGMIAAPSGKGYWLVASDGGIFAFGDAAFFGSTGNIHLVSPIIGAFAAIDGRGYYLYAADGGMFVFQASGVHEPFYGSVGGAVRANPIVGARLAADGLGYYFDDSAGILYNFGPSAPRATPRADMSGVKLFRPMIGMM